MSKKEPFEGLKKSLIQENEEKYGDEIRETYGDDTIDESNRKMLNLSQEDYDAMQQLDIKLRKKLEQSVTDKLSPEDAVGKELAQMHKKWLSYTWPSYSPEAHRGLTEMYIADERFRQYYDRNVDGCAQFLRNAVYKHM